MKLNNEITVKIKCELSELYRIIKEQRFEIIDKFSINDTFFIPADINIDKMSTREILSKALLIRQVEGKMSKRISKSITFKIKNFDEKGDIINQETINCDVINIEDAKSLIKAIGYKEIMIIKEDDVVYIKDGVQFAVKDIENGDKLIEMELEENKDVNSIEELKQKLSELKIPIYTDSYFVKKAEIELDKILKR